MRRFSDWFGLGMGFLLLSGAVAHAGQKAAPVSHAGDASEAAADGYRVPGVPYPVNFDPSIFDETSATIDNPWWPLPPGKQLTWEGTALDEDGETIARKVVFTVTDMTKEIAGVQTLVGWDRDYDEDDMVTESELIFLAQAKDGTVWHLGEAVEHYEFKEELGIRDHYDGTRVWMVGYLEGCKAGIYMPGKPELGMTYNQGFAPHPWDWDDWAEIHQMGLELDTPVGKFTDVMAVREYEPLAPGVSQLKYYAKGVGTVGVGWMGEKDEEREEMRLTKNVMLSPAEMAEVRNAVRGNEKRAYMYSLTEPATPIGGQTAADDEALLKALRADSGPSPAAPVRNISDDRAKEIALATVSGDVTGIGVEKKLGKRTIVVEVLGQDGSETDVIIDMESGEVLGTEN